MSHAKEYIIKKIKNQAILISKCFFIKNYDFFKKLNQIIGFFIYLSIFIF